MGGKQPVARIHSAGRILGEIDLSICGSRYEVNIRVSGEVVESILIDYLRRQGGEVVRSSELIDLKQREEGFVATVRHNGTTEHIPATWVVGCDGAHSSIRKLSGIELGGRDITQ